MSLSKPKWKGSYDSGRKYNKSGEEKFVWLKRASEGSEDAYCKLCKTTIAPKASRLADHEKTKGPMSRVNASAMSQKLPVKVFNKKDDEIKRVEIELAVSFAYHCTIASVDHVGEVIKRNGKGSILENIQIHRTKCSKIISKVVSPALFQEFKDDVQGKKFCVLIDESTDVATDKHLCIVIRYYSESKSTIVTEFGGLAPVVGATGHELFVTLNNTLENMGLEWSNCVGFGSDGASAMIGEHNSVWSRVREKSPNCQLNKCVCHSLALCVEKAFDKLPSNLGYLLHEVPKWFSKSVIRREAFKDLFKVMDANEERKGQPLPFQKLSNTRWLVRGKIIYNILVNWEELKAYFSVALPNADASCRYKAREIFNMLRDKVNLLYFHFVSPIVTDFERLNALFQATDGDPEGLVKELLLIHKTLQYRVLNKRGEFLPTKDIDYGAKFTKELNTYIELENNSNEVVKIADEIRHRCSSFLFEALKQVENRLPASTAIFQGLSAFSPSKVLSQTDRVSFKDLPLPHLRKDNEDSIEQQYRKILHLSWAEESVFNGEIPKESVPFWSGVLGYKNSTGNQPFKELGNYAMACLTTPISNAVVERIFSSVTCVKTKLRNRMSTAMLEAILRTRTHLQFQGKCCKDFKVNQNMLELFNSVNMYEREESEGENAADILAILNMN
ncbi:protein FAM200C-like [Palaemon carinicauda]|uniref:protein FAM200C-like n=1 Tax=Palaemon carinicauda TaxID=392227 RepID=UPI0035B5B9BC